MEYPPQGPARTAAGTAARRPGPAGAGTRAGARTGAAAHRCPQRRDRQALLALCGLPTARGMLDRARALCAGKQRLVGQEEFFRRLEQLAALEEDHGNMSVGACKELEAWLSGLRETC